MKPVVKARFRLDTDYQVRPLVASDVNDEYVSWLNDPVTTRYMAVEAGTITVTRQREYIRRIIESKSDAIFGLFDDDNRLIGSSGVQKLNMPGDGPWIGVLIGPRECRGLGLGIALLWIVTYMLFSHLNATKVHANMHVSNVASYKAFLKVGYRVLTAVKSNRDTCSESEDSHVITVLCSRDELVSSESVGITDLTIYEIPIC